MRSPSGNASLGSRRRRGDCEHREGGQSRFWGEGADLLSPNQRRRKPRPGPRRARGIVFGLVLWVVGIPSFSQADDGAARTPFRVAFISTMFTEVNESDARASIKAWATSVARERGIEIDAQPTIVPDAAALGRALKSREVDAAGLTTVEYLALEPEVEWGTTLAATVGNESTDTYVLLVHRESGFESLRDLAGSRHVLHENPRTSLAEVWLEGILREAGLASASDFFRTGTATSKLSQVVLPVFFHQADACVVTRQRFDLLAELNPQLGRDLRVLAASPAVLATVFCFRGGYDAPFRDELMAGLRELHLTAAGRQILTVFQSDRLEEVSPEAFESARRLLAAAAPARSPNRVTRRGPQSNRARPGSGEAP